MLKFYVKFASVLAPYRKLIALIGIFCLLVVIVILAEGLNETTSAIIFLCLSISLLSVLLYSVSQYFLNFPTSIGDTKGLIKRFRLRVRLVVAWIFSVVMTVVIIKIVFLSLRVVKLN
ncbi:hypothetical protein MNBD_GAMMA12-1006 [hydrothermal vent metagenome]|uniref:Uncharacterized protein n=1 Tax=hydrothermal vent metagenome TaxID=652676 RepID=A0A3B0YZL3_9ZZZZ